MEAIFKWIGLYAWMLSNKVSIILKVLKSRAIITDDDTKLILLKEEDLRSIDESIEEIDEFLDSVKEQF